MAAITFGDLAGADEAIEELAEIRDYLADPGRFAAMGALVPRGVLLDGSPGGWEDSPGEGARRGGVRRSRARIRGSLHTPRRGRRRSSRPTAPC
ncbi:MAG: hypothetical protein ACRDJ4_16015 [Actinomycetota bacterium]